MSSPAHPVLRYCFDLKDNNFTELCSGFEAGSYVRLIDACMTQLKAQGPSRTCNESKDEEEEFRRPTSLPSAQSSCSEVVSIALAPIGCIASSLKRTTPGSLWQRAWLGGLSPLTLNPTPSTLHPKPYTLNPTPSTLHPKPYTLNPAPSTLTPTP